jgi:hypothetical protein
MNEPLDNSSEPAGTSSTSRMRKLLAAAKRVNARRKAKAADRASRPI